MALNTIFLIQNQKSRSGLKI